MFSRLDSWSWSWSRKVIINIYICTLVTPYASTCSVLILVPVLVLATKIHNSFYPHVFLLSRYSPSARPLIVSQQPLPIKTISLSWMKTCIRYQMKRKISCHINELQCLLNNLEQSRCLSKDPFRERSLKCYFRYSSELQRVIQWKTTRTSNWQSVSCFSQLRDCIKLEVQFSLLLLVNNTKHTELNPMWRSLEFD